VARIERHHARAALVRTAFRLIFDTVVSFSSVVVEGLKELSRGLRRKIVSGRCLNGGDATSDARIEGGADQSLEPIAASGHEWS